MERVEEMRGVWSCGEDASLMWYRLLFGWSHSFVIDSGYP